MPPLRLQAFSSDLYKTAQGRPGRAAAGVPALRPTCDDEGKGDWMSCEGDGISASGTNSVERFGRRRQECRHCGRRITTKERALVSRRVYRDGRLQCLTFRDDVSLIRHESMRGLESSRVCSPYTASCILRTVLSDRRARIPHVPF